MEKTISYADTPAGKAQAQRIITCRLKMGCSNAKTFFDKYSNGNFSYPQYQKYESGERLLSKKAAILYASIFGVDWEWLKDGDSNRQNLSDNDKLKMISSKTDNVKINILDVKACCGSGIDNFAEKSIGCWQMPLIEFKKISFADPHNIYMIQATGDSMQPTIADGDWALVDLGQNFMSSDGIYLIRLANGLAIKRLQAGLNNITIRSDNTQYGDITAEAGELTVIGKIIYILNAKKV